MTFIDILHTRAQTDRIAAVEPNGKLLSYSELDSRSDAIAADWLKRLPDKSPVLIRGDKENDIICCMFAAIKSAHPYSFTPGYFPEKKLRALVEASGASLLVSLCGKPEYELPLEIDDQTDIDLIAASGEKPDESRQAALDDIVSIFFTSGSTGNPKGVMMSRKNLECMERWWTGVTDRGIDGPRVLNFSPYTFSASLATVYSYMLRMGGTLYAVDRSTAQDFPKLMDLIYKVDPHCLDCTPSFIDLCMQNEQFGNKTLPSMRFISVGGEALTRRIAETLMERFPETDIINGYGATETTIGTVACQVTKDMLNTEGPMPIGYTAEESYVLVVDENHNPVPDGTPGEMAIVSDMISQGYLKDSERTAKAFFTDENGTRGYYTGDIVRREPNGLIYYIGRTNNMVKIGGYRVELEEIELRLNAVEGIMKGVVVPVYEEQRAKMLAAFVIMKAGYPKGLAAISRIKKALREILPAYMVPQKILFIDELPKNNNDKLDRNALIEKVRIKYPHTAI